MKSKLFASIDREALADLARALLTSGLDQDSVVVEIAAIVDEAVDWSEVVHGSFGVVLEKNDGRIAKALASVIVRAVRKALGK